MGEAELVAGFAAGEPGSVAEVYRRYGRLVYAVSYRVLGDASLAEDATGRTFVRAWHLAASFDSGQAFELWLARIAGRTAIQVRDGNWRRGGPPSAVPDGPAVTGPTASTDQIDDVWLVRRVLDSLPNQDRELIRLQHDRRLTPSEIADRLAVPIATVKSRSHQAHRRFALLLGKARADRDAVTPRSGDESNILP